MPPAGVGDPRSTSGLLRDRGMDVTIEHRVAGMAKAAFEDRRGEPLGRRHEPAVVLRKLAHASSALREVEQQRTRPPRIGCQLDDLMPLGELVDRSLGVENRLLAVPDLAADAQVLGHPDERRRGPRTADVEPDEDSLPVLDLVVPPARSETVAPTKRTADVGFSVLSLRAPRRAVAISASA